MQLILLWLDALEEPPGLAGNLFEDKKTGRSGRVNGLPASPLGGGFAFVAEN